MGIGKNAYHLVENELAVLMKLEHPLTLALQEIIDDPEWDKLYIVTEFIPGGTLEEKILKDKNFQEEDARRHFMEIIMAIEYSN